MSIADKIIRAKTDYDEVYEAGKEKIISIHPEKTVSGHCISLDDVSELPHNVKCKVSGVDTPQTVQVTRSGKNIVDILNGAIQYKTVTIREKTENTLVLSCTGTYKGVCYILPKNLVGKYLTVSGEWDNANGAKGGLRINWIKNNNVADMTSTHITTGTSGNSVSGLVNPPPDDAVGLGLIVYGNSDGSIDGEGVVSYRIIQVEVGNVATEYEPYNRQTLTPSADGTVEGITSTDPKMNIFTDNADAMLDVTYRQSKGMLLEYDAYWDVVQNNGKMADYEQRFFGFPYAAYDPKYDFVFGYQNAYAANGTFRNNDFVDIKRNCDFTRVSYAVGLMYTFHSAKNLVNARTLKVVEELPYTGTFTGCTSLAEIRFEGPIGKSIEFKDCPLTKESFTNVTEHLSNAVTGQTATFKKTAKEAAFTDEEWEELIATRPNWTFSLV